MLASQITVRTPLLNELYTKAHIKSARVLARIGRRNYWLPSGVVLTVLLSLFISFPRISFFTGKDPQIVNFWPVIEEQAAKPLSPNLSFYSSPGDHSGKRAFRLTMPVTMMIFGLNWKGLLLLQFLVGTFLLYCVGRI